MSIDHTTTKNPVGVKLGQYTKYQREKRGLSLNEFAKRIDVTTSFLLRLERGTYKSVKFDIIEKIAKGFNMTVDELLVKCDIIKDSSTMPPLEFYLKEKYQFPEEAIRDVRLIISMLKLKYKKEITELKEIHRVYWEEKKK